MIALSHHSLTVAMINRCLRTRLLVQDYFDLPRRDALMSSLLASSLGQADLVLCLLRLRDDAPRHSDYRRLLTFFIRRLVGRPILVGAPCLLHYRINGHAPRAARPLPGDRRLVWVTDTNPRQPGTEAHARWSEFRVGRTVSQLRVRGVTRRDLRRAERRNWVRFEEV